MVELASIVPDMVAAHPQPLQHHAHWPAVADDDDRAGMYAAGFVIAALSGAGMTLLLCAVAHWLGWL